MRLLDIVIAYNATEELSGVEGITPSEQWQIYKFRQEAKVQSDFYSERSSVIRDKYMEFADESGNLFGDKSKEYVAELEELGNLDVDFEENKRSIHLVNGINFKTIEKLDKFFDFIV